MTSCEDFMAARRVEEGGEEDEMESNADSIGRFSKDSMSEASASESEPEGGVEDAGFSTSVIISPTPG